MKLIKTLVIVTAVLLTGCATSFNVSSTANPSETLMRICPKVDHKAPQDFGEAIQNYDELLDMYTECRVPHNGLVEFLRKKK